ncbi:Putative secreted protein [Sphingopyxis fribergensis]|uniref:Putative secreted protein n=2 Tax=Sphingopyxis fribergensis TaxID=1515612 RepID=A0A0A7PKV6_9SPHN|nr:Putative secreted protein [Sphingopyxis fribergensis]
MDFLIAAAAAATAPAAPAVAAAPVALSAQSISPADVAAYIDPRDIASFMPAPPPTTELVAVSDSFFNLLENITMVALFVVGFFLLARLLHAWMLHRSIRRALEAKSDAVSPLIDKLNKPYEHIGGQIPDAPGDDRNALVLLAIGLAMAGFGLIQGHEQLIRTAVGAALFPIFVGIALLVRRRLARAAAAEERAAA